MDVLTVCNIVKGVQDFSSEFWCLREKQPARLKQKNTILYYRTSAAAASQSQVGTSCASDYIQIPQGVESTVPAIGSHNTRFCGRFLNTNAGQTASVTICCKYDIPLVRGGHLEGQHVFGFLICAFVCEL